MSIRPSNPSRKRERPIESSANRYPPRPASLTPEVVDPRWIAKAAGVVVALSILFAYLSICFLIYQGGWQLMLHPSSKTDVPTSLPVQIVHFDAVETGTPRLVGWWLASEDGAPNPVTILYLHDGSGSLPANADRLTALHQAGVNVFAIDYRGYGQSAGPHPSEQRMTEDTEAALAYLTETRHLELAQIVPYGEGLGAVPAAKLAAKHPKLSAVIVDSPDPLAFDRATRDESNLLPTRLLVQEHFDLAAALAAVKQPKLLLRDELPKAQQARSLATLTIYQDASQPKITVTFAASRPNGDLIAAIKRFLDEYLKPS